MEKSNERSMAHTKARLTLRPIQRIRGNPKMRLYLQVDETMTEEEMLLGQPQSVKLEVADKADALQTLEDVKPRFKDLKWRAELHKCRHEHTPNEPCTTELLEEEL